MPPSRCRNCSDNSVPAPGLITTCNMSDCDSIKRTACSVTMSCVRSKLRIFASVNDGKTNAPWAVEKSTAGNVSGNAKFIFEVVPSAERTGPGAGSAGKTFSAVVTLTSPGKTFPSNPATLFVLALFFIGKPTVATPVPSFSAAGAVLSAAASIISSSAADNTLGGLISSAAAFFSLGIAALFKKSAASSDASGVTANGFWELAGAAVATAPVFMGKSSWTSAEFFSGADKSGFEVSMAVSAAPLVIPFAETVGPPDLAFAAAKNSPAVCGETKTPAAGQGNGSGNTATESGGVKIIASAGFFSGGFSDFAFSVLSAAADGFSAAEFFFTAVGALFASVETGFSCDAKSFFASRTAGAREASFTFGASARCISELNSPGADGGPDFFS